MADLSEYTATGDLDAPFAVTKSHTRRQREAERIRDALTSKARPLTWAEYLEDKPCPGCGRPYRDADFWPSKGTMYFTPEERERYDTEEKVYKGLHGSCASHRHRVQGSITTHCGRCCPTPPMSPEKVREVSQLLATQARTRRPEDLMRWRVRFFCGHVAENTAHRSYATAERAFGIHGACGQCGLDPAIIVDARPIGLAAEPTPLQRSARQVRRPTRGALEARIRELEAEVARLAVSEDPDEVVPDS